MKNGTTGSPGGADVYLLHSDTGEDGECAKGGRKQTNKRLMAQVFCFSFRVRGSAGDV